MKRGDRVAGRFEILGEAARGGMGTVFRARDWRDRRDVALKVLVAGGDDGAIRFAREAAILASLRHDHIVLYVGHGAIPGRPDPTTSGPDGGQYLVMEWVEGETLAARLAKRGVELREAIAIGVQLAEALSALHEAGVVHRDLKPSNVMLVGDQHSTSLRAARSGEAGACLVKLVDFGVARQASAAGQLTRTGMMVGTAGYMAPEQARGERDVDARCDLFALGCVLFECVTGTPAFRGDSLLAFRAKVMLHDPPRLQTLVPEVPPALDALVAALLAREPSARPASARDVAAAFAAIAPVEPRPPQPSAPRDDTTVTSTPAPAAACAVLVVGDTSVDEAHLAGLPVQAVRPFAGGLVVACANAIDGQRIAIALAPLGVVAMARGASLADAIDRSARLLDQVVLASEVAGETAGGAWTDAATAQQLGLDAGARVRIA